MNLQRDSAIIQRYNAVIFKELGDRLRGKSIVPHLEKKTPMKLGFLIGETDTAILKYELKGGDFGRLRRTIGGFPNPADAKISALYAYGKVSGQHLASQIAGAFKLSKDEQADGMLLAQSLSNIGRL